MLCDKADCNYYDSSMEYNCAWGNDGSSSIMCMTHDYKRYCQRPLTSKSGYVSGVNYKQLYESEKHLRELSEARFRAAEKHNSTPYIEDEHSLAPDCDCDYCKTYKEWQQSIKEYEEEVRK